MLRQGVRLRRRLDGDHGRLAVDTSVRVVFDRGTDAAPVRERTTIARNTAPARREVTLLRA